jgi:hypothetical protein
MNKQKYPVKVKAGELQDGLQRFSFIVDTDLINRIKELATDGLTIKSLMDKILKEYLLRLEINKDRDAVKANKKKLIAKPKASIIEIAPSKVAKTANRERRPLLENVEKIKAHLKEIIITSK